MSCSVPTQGHNKEITAEAVNNVVDGFQNRELMNVASLFCLPILFMSECVYNPARPPKTYLSLIADVRYVSVTVLNRNIVNISIV